MSEDHINQGSAWVRLRFLLHGRRNDMASRVLTGELERDDYLRLASRITEIDAVLELMENIASGGDRPVRREPVPHVEDR